MVGLGNKYPKQLLNSAVHKVLFSDSTVVNADYDNRVQDEYLAQKYELRTWSLLSTSHPRRYTVRVTRCHLQD
jgi:hypothetical protein